MSAAAPSPKNRTGEPRGIEDYLGAAERLKLSRLALLSRYVVEGNLAGAHRSPLRGPSSEFADHKAYGIGDDPKHIDWRVLARVEKYYVKRYEDETNLRVYLALDRSASMDYGSGRVTKYQYAAHLAAALGYVVVQARDSVGLYLHADKVVARLEARNSIRHLNDLLKQVASQPPASTSAIAEALHELASQVRRRALVIVLSDLLGDEKAIQGALARLRKQHHDVILLQVLDPAELDLPFRHPSEFTDLETGERLRVNPRGLAAEYQRVFGAFLEQYRETCAALRIDYRLARTDRPFDDVIRAYLQERRRMAR